MIKTSAQMLWDYIKKIQMKKPDGKRFLDGYLCLSDKQCQDIDNELEEKDD